MPACSARMKRWNAALECSAGMQRSHAALLLPPAAGLPPLRHILPILCPLTRARPARLDAARHAARGQHMRQYQRHGYHAEQVAGRCNEQRDGRVAIAGLKKKGAARIKGRRWSGKWPDSEHKSATLPRRGSRGRAAMPAPKKRLGACMALLRPATMTSH